MRKFTRTYARSCYSLPRITSDSKIPPPPPHTAWHVINDFADSWDPGIQNYTAGQNSEALSSNHTAGAARLHAQAQDFPDRANLILDCPVPASPVGGGGGVLHVIKLNHSVNHFPESGVNECWISVVWMFWMQITRVYYCITQVWILHVLLYNWYNPLTSCMRMKNCCCIIIMVGVNITGTAITALWGGMSNLYVSAY